MSYLLYAHFFVQKNVEVNMLLRAYPNIYYRTNKGVPFVLTLIILVITTYYILWYEELHRFVPHKLIHFINCPVYSSTLIHGIYLPIRD